MICYANGMDILGEVLGNKERFITNFSILSIFVFGARLWGVIDFGREVVEGWIAVVLDRRRIPEVNLVVCSLEKIGVDVDCPTVDRSVVCLPRGYS